MNRSLALLLMMGAIACKAPEPRVSTPDAGAPVPALVSTSSATDALYTLRFPSPNSHLVEVEASFRVSGRETVTLMMPVWTPGSYLVREPARHVESFSAAAEDGRSLTVTKTAKNRFRIASKSASRFLVRYRVYCREPTVRTCFVDHEHAALNGAPIFFAKLEDPERSSDLAPIAYRVRVERPAHWAQVVTALPPCAGAEDCFTASSFDELVDSPMLIGSPDVRTFEVHGVEHVLATLLRPEVFDGARAVEDAKKIFEAHARFWGAIPYSRYVILNVLEGQSGGLEHMSSTLIRTSQLIVRDDELYQKWLGLVSHEAFHVWNGKRLRPEALGPFDYEREVYTRDLWMVEGLTSYYDDLLLARAGLITQDEWLNAISDQIASSRKGEGRWVEPLEAASFDAWIKLYRQDERSPDVTISYYSTGAVLGFLLDARIRQATRGARSLDDVMRLAYARHAGARGYTTAELMSAFEEVAGAEVRAFTERSVRTPGELDLEPALTHYGLRLAAWTPSKTPWLGVETKRSEGRVEVTRVSQGSPAARGGVYVQDEIVAVDGRRIDESLGDRLRHYAVGDGVELLVAREGRMTTVTTTLAEQPRDRFQLERAPKADRERLDALTRW